MAVRKIWYVDFPTYQYNEDVVALAKAAGLSVVDARFDNGDGEKDVPKLTIKGAKPKAKAKPKAEPTKIEAE